MNNHPPQERHPHRNVAKPGTAVAGATSRHTEPTRGETEPLHVLTTKMANYANHAARGGPNWPVLFWLHSRAREQHLHRVLTVADVRGPVATAVRQDADGPVDPTGPIWLTHRSSDAPRRLLDLADLGDPAPTPDDDTPSSAN